MCVFHDWSPPSHPHPAAAFFHDTSFPPIHSFIHPTPSPPSQLPSVSLRGAQGQMEELNSRVGPGQWRVSGASFRTPPPTTTTNLLPPTAAHPNEELDGPARMKDTNLLSIDDDNNGYQSEDVAQNEKWPGDETSLSPLSDSD